MLLIDFSVLVTLLSLDRKTGGLLWQPTYLDAIPMGRLGKAREEAQLALFLVSEASGYISGQTIVIDGEQLGRGPGI